LNVLLHEAMEFTFEVMKHRYVKYGTYSSDHARYVFLFNHTEFSESCAQCAYFIADLEKDLKKFYRKKGKKKWK
jgi:hypothetical protein